MQDGNSPSDRHRMRSVGTGGDASPSPETGLTRRDWLQRSALAGAGLGAALLGGAGCSSLRQETRSLIGPTPASYTPLPHNAPATSAALHVANRVAFGPRPGEVARIAEIGPAAWVEEQLGDAMDEDPAVSWRVNSLDTQELVEDEPDVMYSTEYEQLLTETQQAALLRATYSRHQLRETMADFWTNHFNIYALKSDGQALVPTDTEKVLRPHTLGSFPEMLAASAHSPAMLNYLDNKLNRNGVANENYARELLELHTLGVKSGYTQKDIQEVARCFTGWTIKTGWQRGQFEYDNARHDQGRKYIPFLNLTIAPNRGQQDADDVLAQLGVHPATGRFLARKLCRRFLGQAPDAVVEKAASAFVKSRGDIRALLRPILLDALLTPDLNRPILKRPLDMVVSSLRALAADTNGTAPLQKHLAAMGQPLYQWPMPDGFPEKATAWTGSLLPRWNFALALTSNTIDGTQVDLTPPLVAAGARTEEGIQDTLIATVLNRPADTPDLQSLRARIRTHGTKAHQAQVPAEMILAETTGLLLASPAFQWK